MFVLFVAKTFVGIVLFLVGGVAQKCVCRIDGIAPALSLMVCAGVIWSICTTMTMLMILACSMLVEETGVSALVGSCDRDLHVRRSAGPVGGVIVWQAVGRRKLADSVFSSQDL